MRPVRPRISPRPRNPRGRGAHAPLGLLARVYREGPSPAGGDLPCRLTGSDSFRPWRSSARSAPARRSSSEEQCAGCGSGLACPDWPLARSVVPNVADAQIFAEYSRRLVAALTGLFLLLSSQITLGLDVVVVTILLDLAAAAIRRKAAGRCLVSGSVGISMPLASRAAARKLSGSRRLFSVTPSFLRSDARRVSSSLSVCLNRRRTLAALSTPSPRRVCRSKTRTRRGRLTKPSADHEPSVHPLGCMAHYRTGYQYERAIAVKNPFWLQNPAAVAGGSMTMDTADSESIMGMRPIPSATCS